MSIEHWKSTITPRPDLALVFPQLCALARKYNKVLTIFDLEATTFRGRPNFGITELGMLHINPKGQVATAGGLVNPEHRISSDAIALTGITNAMVKDAPTWGAAWGKAWNVIGADHIVAGFNSASFDVPAIIDQHSRYDFPDLDVKQHWDIRKMYAKAQGTTKGKLAEVARWLNLDLGDFQGHRATDDAIMTARVFEELMVQYPHAFEAIVVSKKPAAPRKMIKGTDRPAPTLTGSTNASTPSGPKISGASAQITSMRMVMDNLLTQNYVRGGTFDPSDLQGMAQALHVQYPDRDVEGLAKALSFGLGTLIDEGRIPYLEPRNAQVKAWLASDMAKTAIERAWTGQQTGKLAPLQQAFTALGVTPDYVAVRWALMHHGFRAATPLNSPSP